jgi:hypothetical protein
MQIEFKPKSKFVALDFARNRYIVEVFVETAEGARSGVWPRKLLRTLDGKLVERVRKGHYRILSSKVTLRSRDPGCP